MAFQFSHEFHRNWLAASKTERDRIMNDLHAIVELLDPATDLVRWQKQHGIRQKSSLSAEQVSLFDMASDTSANQLDDTTQKNTQATLAKNSNSSFLAKVTEGMAPVAVTKNAQTGGSLHIPETIEKLESIIDQQLSEATAKIKTELMTWLETELAKVDS